MNDEEPSLPVIVSVIESSGIHSRQLHAATQFSVAFLMVFVRDHGWNVDIGPAAQRLLGVFAGIAVLTLINSLLKPLSQPIRHLP